MKKAVAFNIEIDHGQILCSLEKLHRLTVPSNDRRFEEVLRLWVSVYTIFMARDCGLFRIKTNDLLKFETKH